MPPSNDEKIINQTAIKKFQENNFIASESLFYKALIINPDSVVALSYLGLINLKKSKLLEAEQFFVRATDLEKNDNVLLFNLGFIKHQLNKIEEAKVFYEKSNELKKTVMSLNNLASIYWEEGKKNKSINLLEESLEIEELLPTLSNLSNFSLQKENYLDALMYSSKALKILKLNQKFRLPPIVNFVNAINGLKKNEYPKNNAETLEALEIIFEINSEKPAFNDNFFRIIFKEYDVKELKKRDIIFKDQIINAKKISSLLDKNFLLLDDYNFLDILTSKLFQMYLSNELVSDKYLENIFSKVREFILFKIFMNKKVKLHHLSNFLESIAMQSEFNNYIWAISEKEREVLENFKNKFKTVDDEKKDIIALLYACYYPIGNCQEILEFLKENRKNSNGINKIIERQIVLPENMRKEVMNIKSLDNISNNISENVKKQYEEFPYPRWKNEFIKESDEFEKSNSIKNNDILIKNNDILIAGCGTGREAISMACLHNDCNILAIDLSFNSLSYGKIKAEQNNINNIQFLQADILNLDKLDKKFDIISSCGVLHHMENPEKGLKVLSSILKNDGYIKLAFYSAYAREGLSKIKDYIKQKGLTNEIGDLRKLRKAIKQKSIEIDNKSLEEIEKSLDFYSSNELRDLLFHPSEINFNLIEIDRLLKNNNLEFIEFDSKYSKLKDFYKKKFPDDSDGSNLINWDSIEKKQKTIFSSMYIFWAKLKNERY